jgi:sugar lactone lactonase YvrE
MRRLAGALLLVCVPQACAQQFTISTYAGGGAAAIKVQLSNPQGLALDTAGNLYIADLANNLVRQISPSGTVTFIAGTGGNGYSGDGGLATSATLSAPSAVAVDSSGNIYIADEGNQRIRKVSPAGIITTVAGGGSQPCTDVAGPAASAGFTGVLPGLAVDSAANVYVSDSFNTCIRQLSPAGLLTTFAGEGQTRYGYTGDYTAPSYTELAAPGGIAVDAAGDLYIADSGNGRVREVVKKYNEIYPVAGSGFGLNSGDGGSALNAVVSSDAVAVDVYGNVYIAGANRIRIVTADGNINTIAGTGQSGYSGDGGPATSAQIGRVRGIVVDAIGNVYLADGTNNAIRLMQSSAVPFGSFDTRGSILGRQRFRRLDRLGSFLGRRLFR